MAEQSTHIFEAPVFEGFSFIDESLVQNSGNSSSKELGISSPNSPISPASSGHEENVNGSSKGSL